MHPSYADVFRIIKYSLFPTDQDTIDISPDVDWHYIFEELQAQTISTLAYSWLKTHPLPDSGLQKKWMTSCLQQQARWMQIMHAQTQLINLMEQHNIPCVIIKGAAAMMAYPQPALRAVGDIDFLVKRSDYDKAAEILENNSYIPIPNQKTNKHHIEYEKNGISYELHNRLGIISDTDEQLLSIFENGINNRVWHTIGNAEFPALPDDLNGLVLLFHINQHLRTGLGHRQILDWMMYIHKNKNLNDIMPMIRATGMERLALTVTIMCQKYWGLPSTIEETGDYPCDDLMEYIITNGNFGNKKGEEEKIATVSLDTSNPVRLFSRLQRGGLCRWDAAKKHTILRPFAWIYQIGFIIRTLITNKISPRTFIKSQQTGLDQLHLIHQLGLDADRNIEEK